MSAALGPTDGLLALRLPAHGLVMPARAGFLPDERDDDAQSLLREHQPDGQMLTFDALHVLRVCGRA